MLDGYLETALSVKSQVVFITGGPGRGKTALMEAFASQAMLNHPDLRVVQGTCNAYFGKGDPYLPFRGILEMLTGDVDHLKDACQTVVGYNTYHNRNNGQPWPISG